MSGFVGVAPNSSLHHVEQLLADLLWTVNSPSLIDTCIEPCPLRESDVNVGHLSAFFRDRRGYRVGQYFERLILYWLTHVRRVEIVAHGLQIQRGNRTLGEIDFVFRDEQRILTHWEVAVKFYLYESNVAPGSSHFLGPNANDSFETKIDKLFNHQLSLSKSEFPEVENRRAFVKGMIFYDNQQVLPAHLPHRMSHDHLRGCFVRQRDVAQFESDGRHLFCVLAKPHWLSPHLGNGTTWLTGQQLSEDLIQHFQESDSPVLVSERTAGSDGAVGMETGRVFVVADHWPG